MFKNSLLAALLMSPLNAIGHPTWEETALPSTPEEIFTLDEPRESYRFLRKYMEYSNYSECNRAANEFNFWLCMAECEELGLGQNIGGGCAHRVLTNGICSLPPTDTSHCEVFRQYPELSLREEAAVVINSFCVENGYDELRFR